MNSDCSFEQAIAYACRIENCVGFGALQVSVPTVPHSEN
jgi:hypothetical protein